jgi:hypothetical protein
MAEDVLISSPDLAAVRERRASLRQACLHLQRTLDAGTAASDGGARDALAAALAEVAAVWAKHTAVTEAPDGLLAQIVTDSPRLSAMVERLRREHPALAARLVSMQRQLASEQELGKAGAEIRELLAAIGKHRREGGELIYRAYNIDIGLGE